MHFVFEIELLGGIEGTLYADKLGVGMGHEVIYGLIIEVGINGNESGLDAVGGLVHPVLGELRLLLQFIGEHEALLNQNFCYQFVFVKGDSELLFFLSNILLK